VFSPPSSAALHATDHAEACRLNRASSPHQLALSCQSYALIPKLREVLGIMATQSGIRDCLWEVHPEVCFATMNNGAPLMHRKKSAEGHRARSTLVTQAFGCPVERLIEQGREWGAQPDDVLDALASLWTAQRIAAKSAVPVLAASDRQEHLDHPWKVIWR
ncbi:MAG TPA: DUF429 domain-containing protein, partial [Azospirillaceae bacterium]|nr:DUF429 domain-containing protein [Azospirillaceae bacterium]